MYCLNMLRIATVLSEHDPAYEDFQTTFMEHAVRIAAAMSRSGLWDPDDGFFYDALKLADGTAVPIKVHSMVGLIPLLPVGLDPGADGRDGGSALGKRFASFMEAEHLTGDRLREGGFVTGRPGHENLQLSVVPPVRLGKLLGEMLSEDGFLSPHGLRALSKRHLDQPFKLELGGLTAEVDYEPGESTSGLFGGNSNWRGPVWMPTNYLVIVSLWNWDSFMGDDFRVEYPTGSGTEVRLRDVAEDIARRLVSIWQDDENGHRPVFGAYREVPDRPGLARPAVVPRVLPRGHRGRHRGVAPDRLDRPRRPSALPERPDRCDQQRSLDHPDGPAADAPVAPEAAKG